MQCWWRSVAIVAVVLCCLVSQSVTRKHKKKSKRWDVLTFTQSWPYTVCLRWEEDDSTRSCGFPRHKDIWSIHGIWPTKLGTKGPTYCPFSQPFTTSELEPIETTLSDYWVDVHGDDMRHAFWAYEWKKHGSCAASIPELDTEYKYFNQALQWIQKYNMKDILSDGGITPSDETKYYVFDIWKAVTSKLGKAPVIECATNHIDRQPYLMEVRICFDKHLELTDCETNNEVIDSNCPLNRPVNYPATAVTLEPSEK